MGSSSNKKEKGDRRTATQFPTPSLQSSYQEEEGEDLEFSLPMVYEEETDYRYRDRTPADEVLTYKNL